MAPDFLTTRQVGDILGQPQWRIRRVVDSLDGGKRFGGKRIISRNSLPEIIVALRNRGWLPVEEAAAT